MTANIQLEAEKLCTNRLMQDNEQIALFEEALERIESKRQGRDGRLRPQKNIRNPPGKDLAHQRGKRASRGFSYRTAVLQDIKLHHLEHKHEGYK